MKYRHKHMNEIVEAIKYDGNIETIKNNKCLYDKLKEEKIILATNYINNKEIVFIKNKDLYGAYVEEIKENDYIINENGKLRKLDSKRFEEIFEQIEENNNCILIDLEVCVKEKLDNLANYLKEIKKEFEKKLIINNDKDSFEVITKDKYISQMLENTLLDINTINSNWRRKSNGYNFVLLKRINNKNIYYSVPEFNMMFGK